MKKLLKLTGQLSLVLLVTGCGARSSAISYTEDKFTGNREAATGPQAIFTSIKGLTGQTTVGSAWTLTFKRTFDPRTQKEDFVVDATFWSEMLNLQNIEPSAGIMFKADGKLFKITSQESLTANARQVPGVVSPATESKVRFRGLKRVDLEAIISSKQLVKVRVNTMDPLDGYLHPETIQALRNLLAKGETGGPLTP